MVAGKPHLKGKMQADPGDLIDPFGPDFEKRPAVPSEKRNRFRQVA
jgi:hypothetical protein